MKQKIIPGLKKKLLLVEEDNEGFLCKITFYDTKFGKTKKVGKLTDITEGQFSEWVFRSRIGNYKNYTHVHKKYDKIGLIDALLEMKLKTAKESFFSKLEVDGLNDFDFNKSYLFEIL